MLIPDTADAAGQRGSGRVCLSSCPASMYNGAVDSDGGKTDELAAKRAEKEVAVLPPSGSGPSEVRNEKRTPLWRWFSAQTAHSMPARAQAAKHVKDRWNLQYIPFHRIDRALAKEESEHLVGFRELLDEYRLVFMVPEEDDNFAREIGVGGKMIPFAVEICEQCNREALPGTGKCARHGAQWISEKDIADMSRRMKERLLTSAESAIRTLQDLMDNAKSEQVRSQAAAMILDRAGLGAHTNVTHSGTVTIQTMDESMVEMRTRLDSLRVNLERRDAIANASSTPVDGAVDGDVVDAEVVPEPQAVQA